jgi:hypothetical protein
MWDEDFMPVMQYEPKMKFTYVLSTQIQDNSSQTLYELSKKETCAVTSVLYYICSKLSRVNILWCNQNIVYIIMW